MKFLFNVTVNDQDYLDYNIFMMIRSPYGKKQIDTYRITITVIVAIFILVTLFRGGFSRESILVVILMIIILTLTQVFLPRYFSWSLKCHFKNVKKNGKMGYSPESVIEFYEESFVETTPEDKSEHKYSAIERISVVDNKVIYIHVNNVMSYMLPLSSFESKEQYDSFFEFIKTKCAIIDIY